MEKYAIITAAGSSSRMGSVCPKPLLPIQGRPVLDYVLATFTKVGFKQIIVTCPEQCIDDFEKVAAAYDEVMVISGGLTRAISIFKALNLLPDEGIVLVHDGARPLVTSDLVERVLFATKEQQAVIPVLPLVDTIKQINQEGQVRNTVRRDQMRRVQTPQGFTLPILKAAYEANIAQLGDAVAITDDSSLVERVGRTVWTVKGEETNLKITTPLDLKLAELFLAERS